MSSAGLAVPPPKRSCDDDRCPFHGHAKVRGRLLTGKVVSSPGKSFVVIQMEYLHKIRKYNRFERRRSRLSAHLPPCLNAQEGDVVTVAETRPLSKTISFVVVESGRSRA
ncbi:MAG: 30S ribosomal protein S17 [Thaumarchaeota archaeon]|nr:30S ribosomal protein S17 [Nitrososphaerota archaeon]